MNYPTYDILMPSIPHRYEGLCFLLDELDRQMQPNVGVRIFYDNLACPVGRKYHILAHSSKASYISVLEDDDMISPNFIDTINEALLSRPDYVGFKVHWTHDGAPQIPVEHSLKHKEWTIYDGTNTVLYRDINQFNPMKRELALLGGYEGHPPDGKAWDWHWSQGVRASGKVKTEVFIPEIMHYYRTKSADTFMTPRTPWPENEIPAVPKYDWLTEVSG